MEKILDTLKTSYFRLLERELQKQLKGLYSTEIKKRCKCIQTPKGTSYYLDKELIIFVPKNNIEIQDNKISYKFYVKGEKNERKN